MKLNFFVLLLLLAPPASASPRCLENGTVCFEGIPKSDRLEFRVKTDAPCHLTVSLDQESRNLDAEANGKRIFSLGGKEDKVLFTSRVLEPGKGWSQKYKFSAQCGKLGAEHDMSYHYSPPIRVGEGRYISQGFHGKQSHSGPANEYAIDFAAPINTPVYAARGGRVAVVVDNFVSGGPAAPIDAVNLIRVQHSDGTVAEYAHLRPEGAAVKVGQEVAAGDLLGYSGNTGRSTGPHLHFAVHIPLDGEYRRSVPFKFRTDELPSGRKLASIRPGSETN